MSTVNYGIHEMGITRRGLAKLINMINTHHRIMTKSPVCLTHEWTQSFFDNSHHLGYNCNNSKLGSNNPSKTALFVFAWKP